LPTSDKATLLLVIDADDSASITIAPVYSLGVKFTLDFIPQDYRLQPGGHTITFYAVDSDGDISPAQSVTLTVGPHGDSPPAESGSGAVVPAVVGSVVGVAGIGGAAAIFVIRKRLLHELSQGPTPGDLPEVDP
jgi:hypothetical protein